MSKRLCSFCVEELPTVGQINRIWVEIEGRRAFYDSHIKCYKSASKKEKQDVELAVASALLGTKLHIKGGSDTKS